MLVRFICASDDTLPQPRRAEVQVRIRAVPRSVQHPRSAAGRASTTGPRRSKRAAPPRPVRCNALLYGRALMTVESLPGKPYWLFRQCVGATKVVMARRRSRPRRHDLRNARAISQRRPTMSRRLTHAAHACPFHLCQRRYASAAAGGRGTSAHPVRPAIRTTPRVERRGETLTTAPRRRGTPTRLVRSNPLFDGPVIGPLIGWPPP